MMRENTIRNRRQEEISSGQEELKMKKKKHRRLRRKEKQTEKGKGRGKTTRTGNVKSEPQGEPEEGRKETA